MTNREVTTSKCLFMKTENLNSVTLLKKTTSSPVSEATNFVPKALTSLTDVINPRLLDQEFMMSAYNTC